MHEYNPNRREGRHRVVYLYGLVILLIVVGGAVAFVALFASNGANNGNNRNSTPVTNNSETISVGMHPTIKSKDPCGTLMVKAGPANRVTFTVYAQADSFDNSTNVQYDQDRTTNTITLISCPDLMTVPPETDLALTGNGSALTVMGVSGTMKLSMNGGLIELLQTTLEGRSKIETNGGAIVFIGQLGQESASVFSCNAGTLDITLPGEASYNLRVLGIRGPFISNMPGIQLDTSETDVPLINVGSQPSYATLTFDLAATEVLLHSDSF